jgi:hypothetical protein
MKSKTLGAWLIASTLFFAGCTTVRTGEHSRPSRLTLDKAGEIHPAITTQKEVEDLFGIPDRRLSLGDYPEQSDDGTVWLYFEGENKTSARLTLYFIKQSLVVGSVGWDVREGDPEQSVEQAKKWIQSRFANVHFQEREEGWTNPHAYSDVKYFEDPAAGVTLFFRMTRSEVNGISWSDPKLLAAREKKSRKHASAVHCIGGICYPVDGQEKRVLTSPN